MKNKITRLFILILPVLLTIQCTFHNEDDYFKDNPNICYTEDMSYTIDISPIIENNCISCHSTNDPAGGVDLGSYASVKSIAESERLVGALKHQDGFSFMPLDEDQLSDCNISKIEAWIEQGYKEN